MPEDMSNPLSRLFADDQQVDLELLAKILYPYVRLLKSPARVEFTAEGEELSLRQKLLAYLLARKALKESGLIETEKTSPGEIERETKWSGGSIRPTLSRLKKDRLVRSDTSEDGGYYIPNHQVPKVGEVLRVKGDS